MASIRKNPRSGRWEVRFRDASGVQRTTAVEAQIAGRPAQKADALALKASIEADLYRGQWRDPSLGRIRFTEWSEEYLAGAVHKRKTTIAQDRQRLRKHILPVFGHMPLASITPLDVRNFVAELNTKLKPSSTRTVYGTLRAILTAAVVADLIAITPCRGIKLPAKRPTEKRVLTVEELHRLAGSMPGEYRPLVYLAAVGSLRFEELAGLRVGRIHFLKRPPVLEVVETFTEVGGFADVKTAAGRRTIQLPPFLVDMLAEHLTKRGSPGPGELVFVAPRGGPLFLTNFHRRNWLPAVKRAGLVGFTPHGLRHSTVGLMVEMGHHPLVIQRRLGHSSSQTTMDVYGHVLAALDDAVTADFETALAPPRSCTTSAPQAVVKVGQQR